MIPAEAEVRVKAGSQQVDSLIPNSYEERSKLR